MVTPRGQSHRQSRSRRLPPTPVPYADSPTPHVIEEGIRSIVEAWNDGTLPEERAVDLIKVLVASYTGELISRHVENYLERGLSNIMERQIEE